MIDGPDGAAAAPATPAPAPAATTEPATPVVVPSAAPQAPATEAASQSMRDRLAKGGTFAEIFGTQAPDPADAGSATVADDTDGDETLDSDDTREGEEAPADENDQPPTGDEGAESEDELTVELPGRREGDEPLAITVDSPETAERLRQMANGYVRGEQLRQERAAVQEQIQSYQNERAQFEDTVATDPVGLLQEALPVEVQAQVALTLLASEGVLDALPDGVQLEDLLDPERMDQMRLRLENQRLKMKESLVARAQQRKAANENAAQIRSTIDRIIETGNLGDRSDQFVSQAITDIRDYAQRTGIQYIDPNVLPILLAQRMKEYGMNPVEIAEALSNTGVTPAPQKKGAARSGTNTPPAPKSAPASPQKTATQFVKQAQVRRKVAAAAPAGAGPAAVPLTPPPNQTIEERTAWARQHRGSILKPS